MYSYDVKELFYCIVRQNRRRTQLIADINFINQVKLLSLLVSYL